MYQHPYLTTALNQSPAGAAELLDAALCFELPTDGTAPEWVELLPPGEVVAGSDGRRWVNDRPEGVLAFFQARKAKGRDLPFDWEHATEIKAPRGEPAPASAWGVEMEVREGGAVWARPEWTPAGLASVSNREYRYLSPVFLYEKSTGRIVGIKSVGLTNSPNLFLTALNREDPDNTGESPMTLSPAIRAALGLGDDATEAQAVTAITSLKGDLATANNRAEHPDLSAFVPKADHELALNRAETAEKALADDRAERLEEQIETAINSALEDGKIAPATVDYHKAMCRQEGGLEKFKEYVAAAPVVAAPSNLDGKQPDGDRGVALNSEEKKLAELFGNSPEELKQHGA